MPQTPHTETHFTGGELVRDIVIGMSDGLTVPFALAAGLSGAISSSRVVVVAGLAEIAAGSIAMGLGGFLAARSDAEHYEQELLREKREVETIPEAEGKEVADIFQSYGLSREECQPVVDALRRRPKAWVDFMMRFELGLEEPDPGRALRSAITIALAYIIGGLVPSHLTYLQQRFTQRSCSRLALLLSPFLFLASSKPVSPELRLFAAPFRLSSLALSPRVPHT